MILYNVFILIPVPEVTCSHGLTPTQLADNEDLDLRLGETLYLVCEKDSSPTANYSSLLIHRPRHARLGRNCVYNSKLSNAPLRYVWHCEVHSSNSIKIRGIRIDNGNDDPVLNLNIRVHDLRLNVSATDVTQTTRPSEGATQATTTTGNSDSNDDQQVNSLRDDVTTRAPGTSVPENAEKTLGLQIVVVILAAMVLLLVLLVVIMAAKLYRTRGEKSTDQRAEEGALRPTLSFTSRDSEEPEGGGAATINQERPETAVAESERTTTSDTTERTVQERTDKRVTDFNSSSDSTSVLDTSTEPMLKQTPQS